jgi:uncharacterized protein (DUF433 family)
MELADLVVNDPNIMHGVATIRGTRIPVSVILDSLAAGATEAEILDDYPSLTPASIKAALRYAAVLAREEVLPYR